MEGLKRDDVERNKIAERELTSDELSKVKGAEKWHELLVKNLPELQGETADDYKKRQVEYMKEIIDQQEKERGMDFEVDDEVRKGMILWGREAIENIESGAGEGSEE